MELAVYSRNFNRENLRLLIQHIQFQVKVKLIPYEENKVPKFMKTLKIPEAEEKFKKCLKNKKWLKQTFKGIIRPVFITDTKYTKSKTVDIKCIIIDHEKENINIFDIFQYLKENFQNKIYKLGRFFHYPYFNIEIDLIQDSIKFLQEPSYYQKIPSFYSNYIENKNDLQLDYYDAKKTQITFQLAAKLKYIENDDIKENEYMTKELTKKMIQELKNGNDFRACQIIRYSWPSNINKINWIRDNIVEITTYAGGGYNLKNEMNIFDIFDEINHNYGDGAVDGWMEGDITWNQNYELWLDFIPESLQILSQPVKSICIPLEYCKKYKNGKIKIE